MDARMPTRVRLLALVFIVLLGLRPEARLEAATAVAFGPQQIISTDALGANSVHAADLDGDGDLDVLSASTWDSKIAWYENTDRLGAFGSQQVISYASNSPTFVHAADLDGDGDLDVLSASYHDDKIAWYENTDGLGAFGSQQVISTAAQYARSVRAADLDNDGDLDVLSASEFDDMIAWYENTDGLGTFGSQRVISTAADGAQYVHAADLDNDGDLDVLSVSAYDNKIAWYENTDGLGAFGSQRVISTAAQNARSVHAADLDNDGDLDVLSASEFDDKIAWYENTDGLGAFGPQRIISTAAQYARSVHAADLDNDGDLDVLSASNYDDKIAWYENTDGLGAFGSQRVISTAADGAQYVQAADLDGDGDLDVLSASIYDHKIAWYENLNTPPVADAGPDIFVLEGELVTLSGSGFDADGGITAYAWTQTGGPVAALTGAATATASFTAPEIGSSVTVSLTFRLTVTDEQGVSATDLVNVIVTDSGSGGGGGGGGGCAMNPTASFGLEWLLLFAPVLLSRRSRRP